MPNETLRTFYRALQLMSTTRREAADPDLMMLARTLRDAVAPLRDILEEGQGAVSFTVDRGHLVLAAKTPRYDFSRRED